MYFIEVRKKETFGDLPPITKVRYYPYPQATSIATRSGAATITSANSSLYCWLYYRFRPWRSGGGG